MSDVAREIHMGPIHALQTVAILGISALTVIGAEEKEKHVDLSDCPGAVQKTFKREAPGITIKEVEQEIEDGKTYYEAEVKIDGKAYEIEVAEDGTLIEKALEEVSSEAEEVEMKLSDSPEAVQKTMKREAGNTTIEVVEKETTGGKTVYEAEARIDGKSYEIEVAEDGTLISKALEDESDEDD
jgi:uncharacterized membrane protein YkoI